MQLLDIIKKNNVEEMCWDSALLGVGTTAFIFNRALSFYVHVY